MGPHISIKGEEIVSFLGFPITNSLITTWLVMVAFVFLASAFFQEVSKRDRSYFYYAVQGILKMLHTLFSSVLHENTSLFFPLLGSFFFFILLNNWSGLIPGVGSILITPQPIHKEIIVSGQDLPANEEIQEAVGSQESHKVPLLRGGTADLNTTIALALISVCVTQLLGFKFLGIKSHLGKYFQFRNPVLMFVGILELILEFARILSFSFRLFGNMFAGEVLITVVAFILPVFLSFVTAPMFFMEIFVGVIQALVFTMLSAVFINLAISKHH